jgi:hypothetical protein
MPMLDYALPNCTMPLPHIARQYLANAMPDTTMPSPSTTIQCRHFTILYFTKPMLYVA